ncbi:hypothetical protein GCM10014719_50270 [Planomonospora parontospora subsp. antibiotica]|nr:hypothetical protein GCM10014719_50270 [Planomonospora parontospora subsp. antibiotica]GII18551.1 hypothetical protein Ppa05_52770 [Planomonospora parontospora subsp. antibiotica]
MAGLAGINPVRTAVFNAARNVAWIRTTVAGGNRRPAGERRAPSAVSILLTSRTVSSRNRIRPTFGVR